MLEICANLDFYVLREKNPNLKIKYEEVFGQKARTEAQGDSCVPFDMKAFISSQHVCS